MEDDAVGRGDGARLWGSRIDLRECRRDGRSRLYFVLQMDRKESLLLLRLYIEVDKGVLRDARQVIRREERQQRRAVQRDVEVLARSGQEVGDRAACRRAVVDVVADRDVRSRAVGGDGLLAMIACISVCADAAAMIVADDADAEVLTRV